jgi:hypothetical protein
MRIAVVGATRRIGRLTVETRERMGHETVGIGPTGLVRISVQREPPNASRASAAGGLGADDPH